MQVFVLHQYWDTPDVEGSDVIGVFYDVENAISCMKRAAEKVKGYYSKDYWDEDMTWEDDTEIHLGHDFHTPYELATIYCWTITKLDVQ
jgi:hypothetical protein